MINDDDGGALCVCVLRVWDVVFSIGPNVFACRTFAFMDRRGSSVPSQRKLNADIEKRDIKKNAFYTNIKTLQHFGMQVNK